MMKSLSKVFSFIGDMFTNMTDGIHALRWAILVAFAVVLAFIGVSNIGEMHTYDVSIYGNDGTIVRSYKDVEAVRFRFVGDDIILDAERGGVALYVEHKDHTQIVVKRVK